MEGRIGVGVGDQGLCNAERNSFIGLSRYLL